MQKIEISIDWGGIILYVDTNDDGSGITGVSEFTNNSQLILLRDRIKHLYNSQYIDNKYEFTYIGFQSKEAENKYIKAVYQFYVLFKQEMEGKYHVTIGDYFINEYHKIMKD